MAASIVGYNKVQPSGGIKVNKFFRYGVISVGTAYAYEDRFTDSKAPKASGRTDYILDWFGWQPVSSKTSRFPGSTWAVAGHISPVEHGNMIEQAYVTHGFVLHRSNRAAVVPYGEFTVGHDSQGFDWENRTLSGAGVKLVTPMGQLYTDLGAGLVHENRFTIWKSPWLLIRRRAQGFHRASRFDKGRTAQRSRWSRPSVRRQLAARTG